VAEAGPAYATPTIVHFSAVLLLSALLRAPWQSIAIPTVLWGLTGLAGVVYSAIVACRLWTQSVHQPDLEDWSFHALLPLIAYAVLLASPFWVLAQMRGTLFAVGAAALLLLFIGIHNAWDAVTYHVFVLKDGR
jgi:hypothetical protein